MDDVNAFERQLAAEIAGLMGPIRPIDDATVYEAVSTSPRWSFGSMFGATRIASAGVVVALFGGFLLAGVLTTQPEAERLPPVGASAAAQAATAEATISDVPEATAEGMVEDPSDAIDATDPLPGVDLDLREIRPGVFRVRGDGIRDLSGGLSDIAATRDGSVWVSRQGSSSARAIRLGTRGTAFAGVGIMFEELPDGSVVALRSESGSVADTVLTFDGDGFAPRDDAAARMCTGWSESPTASLGLGLHGLLTPGGDCWVSVVVHGNDPRTDLVEARPGTALLRVDADGGEQTYAFEDIGIPTGSYMGQYLAVADDGTVWAAYGGGAGAGLAAFDGRGWTVIPLEGGNGDPSQLAVDADGVVYYAVHGSAGNLGGGFRIFSWDGSEWTELGSIRYPGDPWLGDFRIDDDGTVWYGVLDVSSDPPRRLSLPSRITGQNRRVSGIGKAPNGNVWVTVDELLDDEAGSVSRGLYLVTPEAAVPESG